MVLHQEHDPIAESLDRSSGLAGRSVRGVSRPREVVVVDASCQQYGDLVASAQRGSIGLHFCVDGRSAVRFAREFRADVWLIASELPDMSGLDLIGLLSRHVLQAEVDPFRPGSRVSLGRLAGRSDEGLVRQRHSGIFLVSAAYRVEEEQRALACGVSGYLVHPLNLETTLLAPAERICR